MKKLAETIICICALILVSRTDAKSGKIDKCEKLYSKALGVKNLDGRLRYLQDALTHAKTNSQKVKILLRQSRTLQAQKKLELALQALEQGLAIRMLSSKLRSRLLAAKIIACYDNKIIKEQLANIAMSLVIRREHRKNYILYNYIAMYFNSCKKYRKSLEYYKILEHNAENNSKAYFIALISQANIYTYFLKDINGVEGVSNKVEKSLMPSDLLAAFYLAAGDACNFAKKPEQALKYYNRVIGCHSKKHKYQAMLQKGILLHKQKNFEHALQCLHKTFSLTTNPNIKYKAVINIAAVYRKEKKYSEAIEWLKKAQDFVKKYPVYNCRLRMRIARINAETGKHKLAAEQYKRIWQNSGFAADLRRRAFKAYDKNSNIETAELLKKCDELIKAKSFRTALKAADKAAAKARPDSKYYYKSVLRQIKILLNLKENDAAVRIFESINIKKISEESLAAYYRCRINIYSALKRKSEVIKTYNDYVRCYPAAACVYADYLLGLKRVDAALNVYKKAVNNPEISLKDRVRSAILASEILLEHGDDKDAVKILRKAFFIKGMTLDHKARIALAMAGLYIRYGDKEKAIRVAKKIYRNQKVNPKIKKRCVALIWEAENQGSVVLFKEARSQAAAGNCGEALLIINKALESCDTSNEWYQKALLKKIDILHSLGRYDDAVHLISPELYEVMTLESKKAWHIKMAICFRQKGAFLEASKHYRSLNVLRLGDFSYEEGKMLYLAGASGKALNLFVSSLNQGKHVAQTAAMISEIHQERKAYQKGLEFFAEVLKNNKRLGQDKYAVIYEIGVLHKKQGNINGARQKLRIIMTDEFVPERYRKMAQEKIKEI
ncbi:hypothetical protein P0136_11055 [Lentisphaerota bacterium ZTH]|nr:hypothetical protein JYG24_11425 [Lentisphaerota bacterium]WET05898.1 hypothetical protein P0136_11055 [Lentisphaerota bacterium ZTH]